MTISNSKAASSIKPMHRRRAFTMVEMMVTVTILAIAMASILSTSIFFSKNVASLGNYSTMSRDSRKALEVLARDLHAAEFINAATSAGLTLELPVDLGGALVAYVYDSSAETVTRSIKDASGTTSDVLFDDVSEFEFFYFNRLGNSITTNLTSAKSVQVDATLVKKVITTDTTDYIISARFLMRNI